MELILKVQVIQIINNLNHHNLNSHHLNQLLQEIKMELVFQIMTIASGTALKILVSPQIKKIMLSLHHVDKLEKAKDLKIKRNKWATNSKRRSLT